MNSKKFSEAMSELDSKYVDEAINYKKKQRNLSWLNGEPLRLALRRLSFWV